jgi:oxygen-independent coproporphyrinogen-3 oxidase
MELPAPGLADPAHLERLLARYDVRGPRYTSYPTAPVWTEDFGVAEFEAALQRGLGDPASTVSIYVHVPFCRSLCHFCACNRMITQKPELPARYLEDLELEIGAVRERMPRGPSAAQVHLGGGTPTHLEPDQLRRLHAAFSECFAIEDGAELSVEVDPRVTSHEHLDALAECGFNRISMGVQDLDARVQEAIHRIQPIEQTRDLAEEARTLGFKSVNFDLIYGLPFQTEESFARTLDLVIELRPDRLALYSYAHVTWVAKQQRGFERHDLPSTAEKLRLLILGLQRFQAAGYEYIGMDHFALPDDELARAARSGALQRNFMGYTTQPGTVLVGFGPSAISDLGDAYAQGERALGAWAGRIRAGDLAVFRGYRLERDDLIRRHVIEGIMCRDGVDPAQYRAQFGEEFGEAFRSELQSLAPLAEDGLVTIGEDGALTVTPLGRLFLRNVAMAFDAHLAPPDESAKPLFSRTV